MIKMTRDHSTLFAKTLLLMLAAIGLTAFELRMTPAQPLYAALAALLALLFNVRSLPACPISPPAHRQLVVVMLAAVLAGLIGYLFLFGIRYPILVVAYSAYIGYAAAQAASEKHPLLGLLMRRGRSSRGQVISPRQRPEIHRDTSYVPWDEARGASQSAAPRCGSPSVEDTSYVPWGKTRGASQSAAQRRDQPPSVEK